MADGLVLPEALRQQLMEHARAESPDEACGILAGRDGQVERVLPVRNSADDIGAEQGVFRERDTTISVPGRRRVHYYMDPRDQLRVYNEVDDLGLDIIAYYHSHPHGEARPSQTDLRLATDLGVAYVLVSLEQQPQVRAWRIVKADPMDETGDLIELPLTADQASS